MYLAEIDEEVLQQNLIKKGKQQVYIDGYIAGY